MVQYVHKHKLCVFGEIIGTFLSFQLYHFQIFYQRKNTFV